MDKEDIIGLSLIVICILSFIIPLMIGMNIYHSKTVELEKYKIEMQVNNGDIPKEEGE